MVTIETRQTREVANDNTGLSMSGAGDYTTERGIDYCVTTSRTRHVPLLRVDHVRKKETHYSAGYGNTYPRTVNYHDARQEANLSKVDTN